MSKENYSRSVKAADNAFTQWCATRRIPLHGIHHVITWEEWDNGMGVYIFLHSIAEIESLSSNEIEKMKECYLTCLRSSGYPFERFPDVVFEFDSDENVRKQFAGNYFYRLR